MSETDTTTNTPPATGNSPVTSAPAGQAVIVPPSSTTMPADTDYKAKFDGLRGAMLALQTQSRERIGSLEQQVRAANSEAQVIIGKLSAAEANIGKLTEQLAGLPTIQEQANKATALEAQAQRLEMILRFPEIVGKTEMVDTSEEDENEKFERVNPFLDALLSSTLSGDAFQGLAEQMAGQLGAGEWTEAGEEQTPLGQQPGGAAPPTPVPSGSLDDLRKQALEAQRTGDYEKANTLWDAVSAKRGKGS